MGWFNHQPVFHSLFILSMSHVDIVVYSDSNMPCIWADFVVSVRAKKRTTDSCLGRIHARGWDDFGIWDECRHVSNYEQIHIPLFAKWCVNVVSLLTQHNYPKQWRYLESLGLFIACKYGMHIAIYCMYVFMYIYIYTFLTWKELTAVTLDWFCQGVTDLPQNPKRSVLFKSS